ncbi:MAG: hypothetical protein Q8M92_02275, partial [Candidatus Subteraquimicrobiales bacterium]|nr:hypothetical protein [Candidatus Subteraquimicrobiales bacterium]
KITDSGKYKSVMIGGKVVAACVLNNLFAVEGGSTKPLSICYPRVSETPIINNFFSKSVHGERASSYPWCYGDVYGAGYLGQVNMWSLHEMILKHDFDELTGKHISFARAAAEKGEDSSWVSETVVLSSPYLVDRVENIHYGDEGRMASVMYLRSLNNNTDYVFIVSDKTAEIRKVNADAMRDGAFKYTDSKADVYIVPESYDVVVLGPQKKTADNYVNNYSSQVREIEKDYPNNMAIINKGANLYSVNVSTPNDEFNHKDVSANAALLLANYFTGEKLANINDYKFEHTYAFKGNYDRRVPDRSKITKTAKMFKGDFKKLAETIKGWYGDSQKIAGIDELTDRLTGVDDVIDDEHLDTTNMLQLIDNIITKLGELLLMSRLGKNEISESILSRALYANMKISNEIRGMSSTNAM